MIVNKSYGQSIFDIVVQNYGSIRFLSKFIRDNSLTYSGISTNNVFLIDTEISNKKVTEYFAKENIIVINFNTSNLDPAPVDVFYVNLELTNNVIRVEYGMKGEFVSFGQSIYDFTVQHYGSLAFLSKAVRDNSLNYDGLVYQGDTLLVNRNTGNESNKSSIIVNRIVINNNIVNNLVTNRKAFEDGNLFLFEDGEKYIFE